MVLIRTLLLAALVAVTQAPSVQAGTIIDRIRARKIISCGGEARPGLLSIGSDGHATGLFLDVCRAIGAAVLGTDGAIDFHQYESEKSYDAVRNGSDDLFFLTASEILEGHLAGRVLTGPPIFYETTSIMVGATSPFEHVSDLAGHAICFSMVGSSQRHLEAWFAAHRLDFIRMGYQEDVELEDTYNAKVCPAIAGESTTLAETRLDGGVNHIRSRLLPEPLAVFPIMVGTPVEDAEFSAIVAWAVHTLIRAEVPTTPWSAGGLESLQIDAPELKLDKEWQKRMVASKGTYADIFKRDLGDGSVYGLDRGLNAPLQAGGLFVAPFSE